MLSLAANPGAVPQPRAVEDLSAMTAGPCTMTTFGKYSHFHELEKYLKCVGICVGRQELVIDVMGQIQKW